MADSVSEKRRWPLERIINVSVAALVVFLLAAIVVGGFALTRQTDARDQVVAHIDPALQQALRLESSLVDQETGVRGYALGADQDVLNPYVAGVNTQKEAVAQLSALLADLPETNAELRRVQER